ncbi:MAG TPA: hypothetical protein VIT90_14255 [Lysobacter sp.]
MTASSLGIPSIQALAGTTVASTSAGLVAWSSPLAEIGVPAAVLFMALTGVAAGLLCNPPGGTRKRLFGLAFAYMAVSAAAAVVLPEFPMLAWLKPVAPATALLLAFFAQTLIPVVGAALAERAKRSIGGGS